MTAVGPEEVKQWLDETRTLLRAAEILFNGLRKRRRSQTRRLLSNVRVRSDLEGVPRMRSARLGRKSSSLASPRCSRHLASLWAWSASASNSVSSPQGGPRDRRTVQAGPAGPQCQTMSSRQHCCDRMRHEVSKTCDQHADRFECPDLLIDYNSKFDEYGIMVHKGGTTVCCIDFCPWCGAQLPASKRDRWFDTLKKLGIDPWEDDVPERFQSAAWYQEDS